MDYPQYIVIPRLLPAKQVRKLMCGELVLQLGYESRYTATAFIEYGRAGGQPLLVFVKRWLLFQLVAKVKIVLVVIVTIHRRLTATPDETGIHIIGAFPAISILPSTVTDLREKPLKTCITLRNQGPQVRMVRKI